MCNLFYEAVAAAAACVGVVVVVQGASVLRGIWMPPPLTERLGDLTELALLTKCESRNTTTTVMSSWKCLRTPLSIFFKSEYLISLFFAASCNAAFTNLRALPCTPHPNHYITFIYRMKKERQRDMVLHFVDDFEL